MDVLPVELLRLVYSYCDPPSVRSLRSVTPLLADVGYEFLIAPRFTASSWRNDIDRLHSIALHERLRGSIESVLINLSEVDKYSGWHGALERRFSQPPEERRPVLESAWAEYAKTESRRRADDRIHLRSDDLREAFSAMPNFKELEVTFTQCPIDNEVIQEVFELPKCRRLDRNQAYNDLDAIIFALHGVRLSKFTVDRFPLEIFRLPAQRRNWFTHARSFNSLSSLSLTMDPSGLQGPSSAFRAINGLGHLLQFANQLTHLKLAFHPYTSESSKFALSFRELLDGFTFVNLTDLILEGISCEEEDLKDFLVRHGGTLVRLRLGGRGLARPYDASMGGIHLYEGTFKSLFTGLGAKLPQLERLHLEGIFECEHHELPSHETYNFYPLTNENWGDVPIPRWVRASRKTINCLAFEKYVLSGGPYPGDTMAQQNF